VILHKCSVLHPCVDQWNFSVEFDHEVPRVDASGVKFSRGVELDNAVHSVVLEGRRVDVRNITRLDLSSSIGIGLHGVVAVGQPHNNVGVGHRGSVADGQIGRVIHIRLVVNQAISFIVVDIKFTSISYFESVASRNGSRGIRRRNWTWAWQIHGLADDSLCVAITVIAEGSVVPRRDEGNVRVEFDHKVTCVDASRVKLSRGAELDNSARSVVLEGRRVDVRKVTRKCLSSSISIGLHGVDRAVGQPHDNVGVGHRGSVADADIGTLFNVRLVVNQGIGFVVVDANFTSISR